MSTDISVVVNERGIFRADHLEQLKKDKERYLEETKEQRRADSFSNAQMTARIERELKIDTKLDSSQTNFVSRSLIHTLSQIKMINRRESADILEQAFVVNREGGPGLESINYEEIDYTGQFKLLSGSGTDINEVGTTLSETPNKVVTFAAGMGWTQKDLERAAVASRNGRPVDMGSRKRMSVMRAATKLKNKAAWGDDNSEIAVPGFFSYDLNNVDIGGGWDSKTTEERLESLIEMAKAPEKDTEDFVGEVMILDTASYATLSNPRANTDTSIAQYLLNNTNIRAILKTSYLDNVNSAKNSISADRVGVVYPRSTEVLEFMLPRDTQFFPVQIRGVHYFVPVLIDLAGLFVYKYGTGGPVVFSVMQ